MTWLSAASIGPKLVSDQEVAPFPCPVGSSWSLLWGGKNTSFVVWTAISEALRCSGPFPSSKRTAIPLKQDTVWSFSSAAARVTSLPRVWPPSLFPLEVPLSPHFFGFSSLRMSNGFPENDQNREL